MAELVARWHQGMDELPHDQWQSLIAAHELPFYRWDWLEALERSGSIVPRQGWQPLHLALWREDRLVAVAPLSLKGHSSGDFVFDQSLAQLADQLQLTYYPKLVGMSPLSPVIGYRFHTAEGEDAGALTALMLQLIDQFCRRQKILSCNFLYVDPSWQPLAEAAGCATWLHQQSQWTNPGYSSFDDYLQDFNANQRRNIRRERQAVAAAGLQVTPLVGSEIPAGLVLRMHDFYAQHCARWGPWGSKYLTEAFFEQAAESLADHVVLFSAHRGDPGDPVAMSLCTHNATDLWGRYWGSDEEVENLHFEVCYYAPIAWAIERGMRRFDPGAGGSHKRRRGFLARPHASLHRWYDPRFDSLVRRWLPQANAQMLEEIEAINAELPFRGGRPPLIGD